MFDWTTYSKLTCLQVNVDTILFSDRQFDSFFDTTHTVIGVTPEKCITPSLIDHKALPTPKRNFCPKYSSEETFSQVVSLPFNTTQHDNTNSPKEKKLWHVKRLI